MKPAKTMTLTLIQAMANVRKLSEEDVTRLIRRLFDKSGLTELTEFQALRLMVRISKPWKFKNRLFAVF